MEFLWETIIFVEGLLSSFCIVDCLNKNLVEPMSFSLVLNYNDSY